MYDAPSSPILFYLSFNSTDLRFVRDLNDEKRDKTPLLLILFEFNSKCKFLRFLSYFNASKRELAV